MPDSRPKRDFGDCTSLSRLSFELRLNRAWLSGFVAGMGIVTVNGKHNSKCVKDKDLSRLKARLAKRRPPSSF